jgi:hypothetical protein
MSNLEHIPSRDSLESNLDTNPNINPELIQSFNTQNLLREIDPTSYFWSQNGVTCFIAEGQKKSITTRNIESNSKCNLALLNGNQIAKMANMQLATVLPNEDVIRVASNNAGNQIVMVLDGISTSSRSAIFTNKFADLLVNALKDKDVNNGHDLYVSVYETVTFMESDLNSNDIQINGGCTLALAVQLEPNRWAWFAIGDPKVFLQREDDTSVKLNIEQVTTNGINAGLTYGQIMGTCDNKNYGQVTLQPGDNLWLASDGVRFLAPKICKRKDDSDEALVQYNQEQAEQDQIIFSRLRDHHDDVFKKVYKEDRIKDNISYAKISEPRTLSNSLFSYPELEISTTEYKQLHSIQSHIGLKLNVSINLSNSELSLNLSDYNIGLGTYLPSIINQLFTQLQSKVAETQNPFVQQRLVDDFNRKVLALPITLNSQEVGFYSYDFYNKLNSQVSDFIPNETLRNKFYAYAWEHGNDGKKVSQWILQNLKSFDKKMYEFLFVIAGVLFQKYPIESSLLDTLNNYNIASFSDVLKPENLSFLFKTLNSNELKELINLLKQYGLYNTYCQLLTDKDFLLNYVKDLDVNAIYNESHKVIELRTKLWQVLCDNDCSDFDFKFNLWDLYALTNFKLSHFDIKIQKNLLKVYSKQVDRMSYSNLMILVDKFGFENFDVDAKNKITDVFISRNLPDNIDRSEAVDFNGNITFNSDTKQIHIFEDGVDVTGIKYQYRSDLVRLRNFIEDHDVNSQLVQFMLNKEAKYLIKLHQERVQTQIFDSNAPASAQVKETKGNIFSRTWSKFGFGKKQTVEHVETLSNNLKVDELVIDSNSIEQPIKKTIVARTLNRFGFGKKQTTESASNHDVDEVSKSSVWYSKFLQKRTVAVLSTLVVMGGAASWYYLFKEPLPDVEMLQASIKAKTQLLDTQTTQSLQDLIAIFKAKGASVMEVLTEYISSDQIATQIDSTQELISSTINSLTKVDNGANVNIDSILSAFGTDNLFTGTHVELSERLSDIYEVSQSGLSELTSDYISDNSFSATVETVNDKLLARTEDGMRVYENGRTVGLRPGASMNFTGDSKLMQVMIDGKQAMIKYFEATDGNYYAGTFLEKINTGV